MSGACYRNLGEFLPISLCLYLFQAMSDCKTTASKILKQGGYLPVLLEMIQQDETSTRVLPSPLLVFHCIDLLRQFFGLMCNRFMACVRRSCLKYFGRR